MSQTFSGFGLWYKDVKEAVSVGDEVTVSGETSGSRGFSDSTHTDTGVVTQVGDHELRLDSYDREGERVVSKSGVSIKVTRHIEGGGTYGYPADKVVIR